MPPQAIVDENEARPKILEYHGDTATVKSVAKTKDTNPAMGEPLAAARVVAGSRVFGEGL